ncbi:MBL fold metallo-hydrolase [Staphylococcus felis]|uniref:MBL fold metallo-hydrolase n=1 Tax=Staphylococcus felis TaxID=46127 RepID=UPI000E242561|nr:MBL fold metallo-hydrolase [Staphylococcus felis]REH84099.1 MBL fold metallo-hydrolase [Staphylococcus felis]REH87878.1 MBL fold metallo-hydrolase [Staphylococcus felis]
MIISYLTLGPVSTNTYFIENEHELLLVDPSADVDKIIDKIKAINKPLVGILLTHAHFDHIGALDDVLNVYPVDVYVHHNELTFLTSPEKNGSAQFKSYGLPVIQSNAEAKTFDEGTHQISSFTFKVMHTPGHSPGSLTYVFEEFAVVGDTLFNNGIGRTDLYQGDYETLIDSIQDKIFTIDDMLPLYPGHGLSTTVENELMNPYLHG